MFRARKKRVVFLFFLSLSSVHGALGQETALEAAVGDPAPAVGILKRDELSPGEAVIVEVDAGDSLASLEGQALARHIVFWSEGAGRYRGLLGFDREDPPGAYVLTLRFRRKDGGLDSLTSELAVREKDFGVARLRTPGGTKKPSEETLARIRKERATVDSLLSAQTPERLWEEPFTAPLARLTVTGDFGTGRIINGTGASPHGGLDLRGERGTPIVASNDGIVALTADHYFAGRSIYLDHGAGLYSMYFHCEDILVRQGERVKRGQTIGTVGMSGRATGPHLHWAFTLGRARVDPLSVLSLPVKRREGEEAGIP